MGFSRKKAMVSNECVACGCCERKCPLKAVFVFRGMYARVDERRCVGCGRCVDGCPAQVISIGEKEAAS